MPKVKSTTGQRGYGGQHKRLRTQLLPHAYGQTCHYCGHPMLRGQPLDLDHTHDRTGYNGMTHAHCNRAAGARKRNKKAQTRRAATAYQRNW